VALARGQMCARADLAVVGGDEGDEDGGGGGDNSALNLKLNARVGALLHVTLRAQALHMSRATRPKS
jgi:hypothetical protein